MAIGLARMFNMRFPLNFNSPYKARSIIDYWQRWHMTLTRYLTPYLYNPLGSGEPAPHGRGLPMSRKAPAGAASAFRRLSPSRPSSPWPWPASGTAPGCSSWSSALLHGST